MELPVKAVTAGDRIVRSSTFDSIFALPHFATLWGEGMFFYVEIGIPDEGIDTVTPVRVFNGGPNLMAATCPSAPQIISGPSKVSNWKKVINTLFLFLKKKYNCIYISVNQAPHDPQFIRGKLDGCKLTHLYDVVIDLTDDLSTIYCNMEKRHRYTLRKSSGLSDVALLSANWLEKTGLAIEEGTSEQNLLEFNELWRESMRRLYERFSGLRKLLFVDYLPLDDLVAKFKKLHTCDLFRLFTIYDEDGQPGASAIFYTSNNFTRVPMVYWTEIASSDKGNKRGLPTLLVWYAIQWFKEHGLQRFYMGGYYPRDPNIGHNLYKRGFGAQIVSGLSVLWLTQPVTAIYDAISLFTKPLESAYLNPTYIFYWLNSKRHGGLKRPVI